MDPFSDYRKSSKGPLNDPLARIHPKIIIGAGSQLDLYNCYTHTITHVINCAHEDSCPSHMKEHFVEENRYACLDAEDSLEVDITGWYDSFKEVIGRFLRDPECKTVFVHCRMGMNRSAFLSVLYVCDKFHYNYDKVCRALLMQRPCALDNHIFHQQVQDYIKKNR